MSYRIHPDTAWVHDPNTDSIHVMPLPAGEPLTIGGTGCALYLDVVDGRDPVVEALLRWDAPEHEIRAGVDGFLQTLVQAGILVVDDAPSAEASTTPARLEELRLLFVCTANICRSAYADVRMRQLSVPGLVVDSAGTHALVGQPMDPPMARHLANPDEGARHRAQQITRELVDGADLIIAMSARHRDYILDEWPHAAKRTFLIGHVARELRNLPRDARPEDVVPHLWTHRGTQRSDSVRDPYGRGEAAASRAAHIIDSHLEVIAEVLGRTMQGVQP